MTTPLVSVIVSAYNCEKFIEESLRSIFNQTFRDFEIIVYNDASTDRTGKIIDNLLSEFSGKHIGIDRIIGSNIGCAEGRNKAIEKATGKYLAIQDGDDVSENNRLEKEVNFIESIPDLFCVGSWANLIDCNGKHIGVFDYPHKEHNDTIIDIFKMINPIIDPSSLFRRDIFLKLGCYDTSYYLVPDLHLWVKAMLGGYYFANILEKLVSYRRHKDSVMGKFSNIAIIQHRLLYKELIHKHKKEVFFRH